MTGRLLLELSIPGDPVPKGRPRMTRSGRAYTPAKTQDAEDLVGWALRAALQGPRARGLVRLELAFRLSHRRRCDIDNLAKLVLDAGNLIVWEDDQQVAELSVRLERGSRNPGTDIRVMEA